MDEKKLMHLVEVMQNDDELMELKDLDETTKAILKKIINKEIDPEEASELFIKIKTNS